MDKKIKKAIALKYPEGFEAPVVVAKGSGNIADLIIKEAEENNIHIELDENSTLIDFLADTNTGDFVPPETWEALAVIFSFILKDKESK